MKLGGGRSGGGTGEEPSESAGGESIAKGEK